MLTSLAVAVLLFLPILALPGRCEQPLTPDDSPTSPSDACALIHSSLRSLAQAERDQALALDLYSHGGELPMVETRFHRLRESMRELREILRRVHASSVAGDPQAAECLKLGYDAVFRADKVSADVERVLIIARGRPD